MEHATKSLSDQQRRQPASRRRAAASAAPTLDNRPAAVAQRQLAAAVNESPRVVTQQASRRVALSPRVIAQRRRLEAVFGNAVPRRSDPADGAHGLAPVQRLPMVNVEGQHQLVDAHDWDLAKTIKWIVNPPAAATQLQIVSMKLHLKAKCLELALKLSQMWPSYQGAYFVYATQDAGSLPSLYFRNSMGQYGRLRAQHGSGPTATRFQYVRHVCGASKSDARSLTTWHRSNKDKKVSEVIAFAKQLNMKEALVGGWYQVELFLDNDASDENQPVKSLHRSGGKVSFDNPIVEGADQNFINSWFSMYIKQFLNFDISKAWLFERF